MIVYVKHQGSKLVRRGKTIQVTKALDVLQTIFIHRLSQLVILGHIEMTPQVINLLCFENIDTLFLTINGRYKGRLTTNESKNVFLRKKQFESIDDSAFRLKTCRSIVRGKLANMATLLGRIKRRNKRFNQLEFETKNKAIRNLISELPVADRVDSIRGYEGKATAVFFEGFRHGFKEDWNFVKRVRRPPTDPVNSVLSLLYTILFNRMTAAVKAANLDPAIGYLHSLDYGRYSLVLDLMEEFRSIVVETCTLSLFNLKILNANSFYYEPLPVEKLEEIPVPSVKSDHIGHIFENTDDGFFDAMEQRIEQNEQEERSPDPKRPCRLRPDALKSVLNAFEDKMTTEFNHPLIDERVNYSEALFIQARNFRKYLEGTYTTYQPLLMK